METLRLFGASLEAGLGPDDFGVVGSSKLQWCWSSPEDPLEMESGDSAIM